jgi:hypothetical protein
VRVAYKTLNDDSDSSPPIVIENFNRSFRAAARGSCDDSQPAEVRGVASE